MDELDAWRAGLRGDVAEEDQTPAHLCDEPGCIYPAIACWLSNYETYEDEVDGYYCSDHAQAHGFCWGCGAFSAGQESFDFSPSGLCDNCQQEPDLVGWDGRDEDDDDWYDDEDLP